jgi:hypothetical protein
MTDSQEGWESEYLYIPGYVAYTNYVGWKTRVGFPAESWIFISTLPHRLQGPLIEWVPKAPSLGLKHEVDHSPLYSVDVYHNEVKLRHRDKFKKKNYNAHNQH